MDLGIGKLVFLKDVMEKYLKTNKIDLEILKRSLSNSYSEHTMDILEHRISFSKELLKEIEEEIGKEINRVEREKGE